MISKTKLFASVLSATMLITMSGPITENFCSGLINSNAVYADSNKQNEDASAFVKRCYEIALDREPDQEGLEGWTEDLLSGKQCGVSVAFGFVYSPEFQNAGYDNAVYVEKMYNMLLGRESDPEGKAYWVDMLNNGTDKELIFYGFANSQEFYNLCSGYGISAGHYIMGIGMDYNAKLNNFVTELYKVCLGRQGDLAGQAFWTENLYARQISGTEAVYGFIFSQEFLNLNTTNEEYISALYKVFLGRTPSEDELNGWKAYLVSSEKSREDVFNGFSGSAEFANLCAEVGIEVGNLVVQGNTYTPNNNDPVTPTVEPTPEPTAKPTAVPSTEPTTTPTVTPTVTTPSAAPSSTPSATPSASPTPEQSDPRLITLSGNHNDVITIDDFCYAESGRIRILLYKGCEVYGDSLEYFNECLNSIENITGLKYLGYAYNDDCSLWADIERQYFYGDAFKDCQSFDDDKMNILVVPQETTTPYSEHNVIVINPIDLQFDDKMCWTAIHEMVHAIHRTNASYLGSILDEGYATTVTNLVCQTTDLVNLGDATSIDENYAYYSVEINKENVEKIYLEEKEDGWENYLYGYRLVNYIFDNYGASGFTALLERSNQLYGKVDMISTEESLVLLKDVFGEDVLFDFVDYLGLPSSIERFNPY
ncbi:MAG: DUF4214 domain-containing protein [Clostridia bacterium]|nr:DUF4214 domain-containing protein [Clostridia bacterium]